MEQYRWGNGKTRLRLEEAEAARLGLTKDDLARFDEKTKETLADLVRSVWPEPFPQNESLLVEIFPGKSCLVLQISRRRERVSFSLSGTDAMLTLYPAAKKYGGQIWQRRDGAGYYLTADARFADFFSEFARPCRIRDGVLHESCRRIL